MGGVTRGIFETLTVPALISHRNLAGEHLEFAPQDHQRAASSVRPRVGRVNDQFFLNEKLERAVPFHVNGVSKIVVNCWKHGDDRATLVVVGCIIDLLANCKLRHRELPSGIIEI
ncbi:MAG: hypothetical protein ACXWKP_01120 [Bradyrhizobium sp.]